MVDITPHALANAIMGQLYDVLTNGDNVAPKSSDNFISWVTPAYPYDPSDFDFLIDGLTGVVPAGSDLTQAQISDAKAKDSVRLFNQAEQLARLVDFVPEVTTINNNQFATFNVNNNVGTLSGQYEFILTMSQVLDQELDDVTRAKIAQFRALLQATTTHTDLVTGAQTQVVGPSPMVQAYNAKMMAYRSAALTYNAARIAAQAGNDPVAVQNFAVNAAILRNQVAAAMDDWIANGYKNDYEEIVAYINAVQQRDLNLLKLEYEQDMANAALTGIPSNSTFYYTSLVPGDFANSPAWTTFTFDSGNISGYAVNSFNTNGWSASATASYLGLVGVAGTASGSSSATEFTDAISMDGFKVSFQIAQVPIVRPWFKEAFITSKAWRFDPGNPDVKGKDVSDGGSPPTGFIAAYPTTAIFIRNLRLSIVQDSAAGQFIQRYQASAQSGGGYAAIGPFFLGGTASRVSSSGSTQSSFTHSWNDQGMSVDGMQLAAFRCHIFAKSPDPDPSITNWV
jgi:hypothetical protein